MVCWDLGNSWRVATGRVVKILLSGILFRENLKLWPYEVACDREFHDAWAVCFAWQVQGRDGTIGRKRPVCGLAATPGGSG